MKLNEIELRDRSSVLRGSKMNVGIHQKYPAAFFTHDYAWLQNFTNVRKLISERMNLLREAQKPGNSQATTSKPGKLLQLSYSIFAHHLKPHSRS